MDVESTFVVAPNNVFSETDRLIPASDGPFGEYLITLVPDANFRQWDDEVMVVRRPANEWRFSLYDCFNSLSVFSSIKKTLQDLKKDTVFRFPSPIFSGLVLAQDTSSFSESTNYPQSLLKLKGTTPLATVKIELEYDFSNIICGNTYLITLMAYLYFSPLPFLQLYVYDADLTVLAEGGNINNLFDCASKVADVLLANVVLSDIQGLLAVPVNQWLIDHGFGGGRAYEAAYLLPGHRDMFKMFNPFADATNNLPRFSNLTLFDMPQAFTQQMSLGLAPHRNTLIAFDGSTTNSGPVRHGAHFSGMGSSSGTNAPNRLGGDRDISALPSTLHGVGLLAHGRADRSDGLLVGTSSIRSASESVATRAEIRMSLSRRSTSLTNSWNPAGIVRRQIPSR